MDEDIQSMLAGMDRGKAEFQGLMPSASDVGGAPSQMDTFEPLLDECYSCLSNAIAELKQARQDSDSNKLISALKTVAGVQQERKKRFAENAKTGNGNSAGMGAVAGLNAMGIPQ